MGGYIMKLNKDFEELLYYFMMILAGFLMGFGIYIIFHVMMHE